MNAKRLPRVCWVVVLALAGCAPYRPVLDGAQVAPRGKLMARFETGGAIPSASIAAGAENWETVKEWVQDSDSQSDSLDVPSAAHLHRSSRFLAALSADPPLMSSEIVVAYGLFPKFEVNYRKLGGGHGYGGRYQISEGPLLVSAGLICSSQDYTLPSVVGKAQELLGYEFARSDFAIPLAIGKKWNRGHLRGEWSWGLLLQKSSIRYEFGSDTRVLVAQWALDPSAGDGDPVLAQIPQARAAGFAAGSFGNIRLGYRWVDFSAGIGVFYNDYGTFTLLDQSQMHLKGVTLVPKIGMEFKSF